MKLLDLPEDVLLSIVSSINVADLHTLLCVSHSVQQLVICAYLRRYGMKPTVDWHLPSASFLFNNRNIQALRGLCVYHQKTPWRIGTAQFRFRIDGNPGYVSDIKRATYFLRHQVEDISILRVDALPMLGKYDRKFPSPSQQAGRSEWEDEFIQLMIVGSNRTRRRLEFTMWAPGGMGSYGIGETWQELNFPSRPVAAAKSKLHGVVARAVRSVVRSGERFDASIAPEEIKVSSRLPLMPRFLLTTTSILSADNVMRLEFDCALSSSEWSHFLPLIHAQNLRTLVLTSPHLEPADMEKFLVRHELTLRELELRTVDVRDSFAPPKHLKLPHLTSLTGRPADVTYILANANQGALPSLHHITIETSILLQDHSCVDDALWSLVRWTRGNRHRISLSLMLQAVDGRHEWLTRLHYSPRPGASDDSLSNPSRSDAQPPSLESQLSCVKELKIGSGGVYEFSDALVESLPNWLARWPALTRVVVQYRFYAHHLAEDADRWRSATMRFVAHCEEKCSATLRSIRIGDEEYRLSGSSSYCQHI